MTRRHNREVKDNYSLGGIWKLLTVELAYRGSSWVTTC